MKQAIAALAVLAAGPATAQGTGAPVISRPDWVRRPDTRDLMTVLPGEALKRGADGRAVLSCEVSREGTLRRCAVTEETPPGLGFGFAALSLAPTFQMRPMTLNGQPVEGGRVNIPIVWKLDAFSNIKTVLYVANPGWIAAPTHAELAAAYPPKALAAREAGRVTLDCSVSEDGALRDCDSMTEAPRGRGFARAALSLKDRFKLPPPADESGKVRRARVKVPFYFSPSAGAEGAPQVVKPEWGRLPSGEQAAAVFPAQAKAAGVREGGAMLDCRVDPGGAVGRCSVARENPAGMGFGEAALRLAPSFAMRAWTSDGRPVDGARVRIPVRFEP